MRIPPRREPPLDELELHQLALQKNRFALLELLTAFTDRIVGFLVADLKCARQTAEDVVVDVICDYVEEPSRYDPHKARLITYLTRAAKYRLWDQRRSEIASARRDQEFGHVVVEFWQRPPKEVMEDSVEANRVVDRLIQRGLLKDEKDVAALRLILSGERSTEKLAEVLGLSALPQEQMRREVKRHRDRLMKILERFGKEDPDDPS
jgi:RNA polymerase sigma-70 factor (ECF subfamily)